jgi:hypothetical protein
MRTLAEQVELTPVTAEQIAALLPENATTQKWAIRAFDDAAPGTTLEPVSGSVTWPRYALAGLLIGVGTGVAPTLVYGSTAAQIRFGSESSLTLTECLQMQQAAFELVNPIRRELRAIEGYGGNWDEEGAEPFMEATIRTAHAVVNQIASFAITQPEPLTTEPTVIPMPDGTILFKWIHGQKELAVTVENEAVEVQRWTPLAAYAAEGYWHTSPDRVGEHLTWLTA